MEERRLETFGLQELDYILFLDNQLYDNLEKIQESLLVLDYDDDIERVIRHIDDMMTDTTSHAIEIKEAKDKILENMESVSRHFEDYMNEPEDDITICRKAHPHRNVDCADCSEPCCPQSYVNMV